MIIPAHNEQEVIADKIHNSLAIDYPKLEIIVAADGCRDATAEIVNAIASPRVRLLTFGERRGKTAVINDAVTQANGEVLCFCDANVQLRPDSLRWLIGRVLPPQVGAVSGDVRLQSEASSFGAAESLYYRMERKIHAAESRLGAMMGVDGGMYVVKREWFTPLPMDTILDDFTISMRVLKSGQQVLYEPRAIATETPTPSATAEFKRRVRISAGVAQVLLRGIHPHVNQPVWCWLFVSHKLLRWLSPWMLLTSFILLNYLSPHNHWCLGALIFAVVLLCFATVGAASQTLRRHWLFAIPLYFVMSQIAMSYGLLKGLLFAQEAIWERTERHVQGLQGQVCQDAK